MAGKVDPAPVSEPLFIKGDVDNGNDSLPNMRYKKSEIISTTFKKEALFGVWTTSHENPACDFEIDEKEIPFM